jgi:hypothetical protein
MKRILAIGAGAVLFGCGGSGTATLSDFRSGLPSSDAAAIQVPDSSGAFKAAPVDAGGAQAYAMAEAGATAGTYVITRGVTVAVNGGTLFVLGVMKAITDQQPTTFDGNTAVWGPWTGSLSPTTWKLTVLKTGDHTYSYALEGKAKGAADSDYVVVLSGTHTPALDENGVPQKDFGQGTFLVDWDQAQTLPEHGNEVGTAAFTYAHPSATADASVDVAFTGTRRVSGVGTTDASYHWQQTPAGDGEFSFSTDGNIDADPNGTFEDLAIHSRWQADGAGRADVIASGGSLPSDATMSECWSQLFQSTYLAESFDAQAGYGDEAADCAFPDASFPAN